MPLQKNGPNEDDQVDDQDDDAGSHHRRLDDEEEEEEEELRGGDRERKRQRERKRRSDLSDAYGDLATFISSHIEPSEGRDGTKSGPTNRLGLVHQTHRILRRLHSENEERKRIIASMEYYYGPRRSQQRDSSITGENTVSLIILPSAVTAPMIIANTGVPSRHPFRIAFGSSSFSLPYACSSRRAATTRCEGIIPSFLSFPSSLCLPSPSSCN